MAICENCNTQMEDGVNTCPSCGTESNAPAQAAAPTAPANDAEDNKVMAILAYIIFFLPFITGDWQKSPFVKFHLNQSLLLVIASFALSFVIGIVFWIPFIGWIIALVLCLAYILIGILAILGIINAANGKTEELPIVGKYMSQYIILK